MALGGGPLKDNQAIRVEFSSMRLVPLWKKPRWALSTTFCHMRLQKDVAYSLQPGTGTSAELTKLNSVFGLLASRPVRNNFLFVIHPVICYFIIAARIGQNINWYLEVGHYFSCYLKRWLWNWTMDKDQTY